MSHCRVLGVLLPDLSRTFYADVVRGASDAAWASGYQALVCETGDLEERETDCLKLLAAYGVEGALLLDSTLPTADLVLWTEAFDAMVVLGRHLPGGCAGQLVIDRADGLRQALRHLVDRGVRNVAYLGPIRVSSARHHAPGAQTSRSRANQQTGDAAVAAGPAMALGEALLSAGLTEAAGVYVSCQPTWEGAYMAARDLLASRPELDAIICWSDLLAVGALHACASLGRRVPYDVAIVGSDDALLARLIQPALTTLHVPKYEVGTMAVGMLLERICGNAVSQTLTVAQRLVVRASTP